MPQEVGNNTQQAVNTANAGGATSASGGNITKINREFQEKAVIKKAKELNLPYINLSVTPLNPDFLKVMDENVIKEVRVVPFFKVGKKLRVATDNPSDIKVQDEVKKLEAQGYEVSLNLASNNGIDDALKVLDDSQKYKSVEVIKSVDEGAIKTFEKEIANLGDIVKKLETVTAAQALNLLDIGAMKTGASDVHYEPEEKTVVVRFRIDGVLHEVFQLNRELYKKLSNQIKYESKMSTNLDSVPQDGRYVFDFNEQKVGVRVSSIPTPFGESFVCRFLPSGKKTLTLEELGFQGVALQKLKNATEISHGMVLVTGPTGSGKSTTLYSMLSKMNTPENKVITLEDPVEYNMPGVTQSQIDEKNGYSFANGLKTLLRQDPDIIMLGEIRDLETSETAAQAALTGHVVLSTLHTNSAIETIPRLINMGLPAFMVAPALFTIVAQRLVRKACPHCSIKESISDSEKKEFEEILNNLKQVNPGACVPMPTELPKVVGCDGCSNTGYSGRIVISEVLTINEELKRLILNNASTVDLIAAARKSGIITIREDGHLKVAQGLTTLEEVHRVNNMV